jgi:hypothetical protein
VAPNRTRVIIQTADDRRALTYALASPTPPITREDSKRQSSENHDTRVRSRNGMGSSDVAQKREAGERPARPPPL